MSHGVCTSICTGLRGELIKKSSKITLRNLWTFPWKIFILNKNLKIQVSNHRFFLFHIFFLDKYWRNSSFVYCSLKKLGCGIDWFLFHLKFFESWVCDLLISVVAMRFIFCWDFFFFCNLEVSRYEWVVVLQAVKYPSFDNQLNSRTCPPKKSLMSQCFYCFFSWCSNTNPLVHS